MIEGRATFTIAMSSTTMNCTASSSASPSHLRSAGCNHGVRILSFRLMKVARIQPALAKRKSFVQNAEPVARKTYCQYCPVAHALDVVGERWSLLIVRELLESPQRYTDLAGHLPGIGSNILAARLRDLEGAGVVVKRKLPPPTPAVIYELTEDGRSLQGVVAELARWGARSLGPPAPEHLSPGWLRYPLRDLPPTRLPRPDRVPGRRRGDVDRGRGRPRRAVRGAGSDRRDRLRRLLPPAARGRGRWAEPSRATRRCSRASSSARPPSPRRPSPRSLPRGARPRRARTSSSVVRALPIASRRT